MELIKKHGKIELSNTPLKYVQILTEQFNMPVIDELEYSMDDTQVIEFEETELVMGGFKRTYYASVVNDGDYISVRKIQSETSQVA